MSSRDELMRLIGAGSGAVEAGTVGARELAGERQSEVLRAATGEQVAALAENTRALLQAGSAAGGTQGTQKGAGSSVLGTVGKTLLGALTLSPLIGGLASLFGFGKKSSAEPVALPRYEKPAREEFEYGLSGGQVSTLRYEAGGVAKPVTTGVPQQVVVQVQALDSQSFLDRSDLVASAVKKALLESHTLADVVGEV